jgi:aminopeptidase N
MFLLAFFIWLSLSLTAQQSIDVQHYQFQLFLNDENNRIAGRAIVQIKFLQPVNTFSLDLGQAQPDGKGMKVDSVNGLSVSGFQQKNNKVIISLKSAAIVHSVQSFRIVYNGIPEDGLIISKNRYGDRTFFADNWPDRAHYWIPCNDTPNDKASVEFAVTAPNHYQVVSNGIKMEETNIDKNKRLTRWKEEVPLPTKIMVIGVAPFAVERVDSNTCVPVTSWVYPQNKDKGFYDYAPAAGILQFFSAYIAPYPFQKLANVQSKTIFGGMENAGAIFYAESSVTGERKNEDILAHEIAHQWFGDMASEKSFTHLWLSEGFATCLADIYWEQKYGREAFHQRLQEERKKVIQFSRIAKTPVVDSVTALMDLLNPNSYEKGAWVLHMLRTEVGDTVFQHIIQAYYQQYKGGNADTKDFQQVAERVTGKSWETFFHQWLYQSGIPKFTLQWKWINNKIAGTLQQTGLTTFQFPLEVSLVDTDGKPTLHQINVVSALSTFELPAIKKPVKFIVDPNTKLLFDGTVNEIK